MFCRPDIASSIGSSRSKGAFEIVDLGGAVVRTPLREGAVTTSEALDAPEVVEEESEEERRGVIVQGIECGRGHFNNPNARYCSTCGLSLVHLTHRLIDGIRPTLGFLVFDEGSTYTVDRSYLIGREPMPDPDSGVAPLVMNDPEDTVSRRHAEIELDGWNVVLRDLGSKNGTFVWSEQMNKWEPLAQDEGRVVPAGSKISVGQRTFVFESADRSQ